MPSRDFMGIMGTTRLSRSSRACAVLLAAIFLNLNHADAGVTIKALTPSFVDVQLAISSAIDGDTVTIPAGAATWTSTLTITKGITLMGQTTTDPVAGTAVDNTIIQENVTRAAGGVPLIQVSSVAGKAYRISGLTFKPLATATNYNGMIRLGGSSQSVRLDHCHFATLPAQSSYVAIMGAACGVADHNVMEFGSSGGMQSFWITHDSWGGGVNGDGAFSAPTAFGSSQFFFIEDNYIHSGSSNQASEFLVCTDDIHGARWVFRHNHCYNIEIQTHGTEDGRYRGGRAVEVYGNDFHNSWGHGFGGVRTGCYIQHDNTYAGVLPTRGMSLEDYRAFFKYPAASFLGAGTGDNPWDVNDTEGNGTNVAGHMPYLYASGTVSSGSSTTLVDTTKSWATNQWVGFTAKRVSDGQVGLIQSNTSNTLTVLYYPDQGGGAIWAAGQQYQIHKVLILLDQPGRGQCDPITGTSPINKVTGTATWPHQSLEPCYSWNNGSVGLHASSNPALNENRDYYNNTPMPGYTPYTYPHPLVSGSTVTALAPPTNLTVVP
jgi:hypothetical protein